MIPKILKNTNKSQKADAKLTVQNNKRALGVFFLFVFYVVFFQTFEILDVFVAANAVYK